MSLPKWNKKDFEYMKDQNYKIVVCSSEKDAIRTKDKLRMYKRCAQAGRVINSKNEEIFFVCTKERAVNGGRT